MRGIIRVSGQQVPDVLSRLLGTTTWQQTDIPATARAARQIPVQIPVASGQLHLPSQLMYWPTQRSFTGEVLAELHLPGSPPLLNEVLSRILTCGARPAERGEFTLRAFLAGRIDLVQAEAVLGVIDAANTQELQTALMQLAGGISSRLVSLREELLLHLADLEAGLDFVEEEIEFVQREELLQRLNTAHALVQKLLDQATQRMLTRGQLKVVLAGLPNAGKSTLFNALLGQSAALVSSVAGTTRDYLSASVDSGEMKFELIDTAGWEPSRNGIEAEAGELRTDQLKRAHLVVWCSAADLDAAEAATNEAARQHCLRENRSVLQIRTKGDRLPHPSQSHAFPSEVVVAAEQGTGLKDLLREIAASLSTAGPDSEMIGTTAARCEESLRHTLHGLNQAMAALQNGAGDELISLELREVLDHLGRMMGRVYTDDILDRIFSRFCIGK